MGSYGFNDDGKNAELSLDLDGLEKSKIKPIPKDIRKAVIDDGKNLGYIDRSPTNKSTSVNIKNRKPGRKPPSEPKLQVMISGPESTIQKFRCFCDAQGGIAYWEGLALLLSQSD